MDDDCPAAIFPSKPCKWLLFYLRNTEYMKKLFNSTPSFLNGENRSIIYQDWPKTPELIRKEAKANAHSPDTSQCYFHWSCVSLGVLLHKHPHIKKIEN